MVDFTALYPGNYPLVDHQIANAIDKGAYTVLNVSGWANRTIFHGSIRSVVPADAPLTGSSSAGPLLLDRRVPIA
jgi:hypothetical protein